MLQTCLGNSIGPVILSLQLTVYYNCFYSYGLTFSNQCLFKMAVCLFLDSMVMWSHYQARQNPGFVEMLNSGSKEESVVTETTCKICNVPKTAQVHHCSKCNRCVFLMDHHQSWTNQCVGYNTIKHFFLFMFYCGLAGFFGVITLIS